MNYDKSIPREPGKLPEPETTPCEMKRVVNKPYVGTTKSHKSNSELVKDIGKITGDKT